MALIIGDITFTAAKEHKRIKTETKATYRTFIREDTYEKILQIDTYGSDNRKEFKSSQNIQLDKKAAIKLVDIIIKEFNLTLK